MEGSFFAMYILAALLQAILGLAQDDVDQCALSCISNVESTNCSQSEWSCLCSNNVYIERMNNCTYTSCNASDQQDTFSVVAELCAILGVPITIGPEATILTTTSNPLLTTIAIPTQSSLPPVMNVTSISTSGYDSGSSSTSSISQTATATSTGASPTGSGQSSVTSSTTSASATTNDSRQLLSPWPTLLILGVMAAMITSKAF